ncbi:MAG TPA: isoamylase [Terriglobales bacterium]|nr:isoamylase [Terriglobales bacterium]
MGISPSKNPVTNSAHRADTSVWSASRGTPVPLGVTPTKTTYNFSLYSKYATHVTLHLYSAGEIEEPMLSFSFDQLKNKTGRVWHAGIPTNIVEKAAYYAYTCDGPPPDGDYRRHAFKAAKLLLDPYAKGVYFPESYKRTAALGSGSDLGEALLGVLPQAPEFDWGNDAPPLNDDLILYEMHVRGFTRNPNSGIAGKSRGTFSGVIEKIPHLQKLGITAVELLPVFEFDESEPNYWGYQPIQFFSPHHSYAAEDGRQVREFKQMVKALHAAGIEVILDVVYNHTGEGNEFGPTFSLKGIDNSTYYMDSLDPHHPYADHTGTGNTLYCAGAAVRQLIVASLRYWAREMHVDGFRFDLATVFTLNQDGSVNLNDPAIFGDIAMDPDLSGVRLIAEPWGADYVYELGRAFPGSNWRQWNDRFRTTIRRFVKGDNGCVADAINRVYGSRDDLFPDSLPDSCRPFQSLNYVTSHDGLTLYDQVSYTRDSQQSWNCGGPDGEIGVSPEVMQARKQQVKNFCSLLLLANGTPMFRMGDEFLQTQNGQDNPYNVDDETTWLNWDRLVSNPDVFRFFQKMIAFRKSHPSIASPEFWRENVNWYGVGHGGNTAIDYSDTSHTFAYCLHGVSRDSPDIYVIINMYWEPVEFTICEGAPDQWRQVVDTGKPSPDDFADEQTAPPLNNLFYTVKPRSIVVLTKTTAE